MGWSPEGLRSPYLHTAQGVRCKSASHALRDGGLVGTAGAGAQPSAASPELAGCTPHPSHNVITELPYHCSLPNAQPELPYHLLPPLPPHQRRRTTEAMSSLRRRVW